jgi:predicted DNA-binding protein with PD1-like motif
VVWKVVEVVVTEILENDSTRIMDPMTGFELLDPTP